MNKRFFAYAKVSARKQISIPKKVQEALGGVDEGDYIIFFEENGRIYIKKGMIKPI